MADDARPSPEADLPAPPGSDRLDSWKEIAAFLKRDVRTVQRWEKHAGLPIHRHPESRLRTAYAYRSELEAWWRAQGDSVDVASAESTKPEASVRSIPGRPLIGVVALLAVAAMFALVVGYGRAKRTAVPADVTAATSPVTVLLAQLDNETGDSKAGALVDETVAREIARQPGVELAGPARVTRLMRLMRLEPGTRLTKPVGREICLRDGRIRFVLSSRVHKLQERYLVDLELIESSDGSVRASVEPRGTGLDDVLGEVRKGTQELAAALRAAARIPGPPLEPLEPVTTVSLPALRLYTAAVQAGARRQWAASELLARRATALDDRFASAYAWVAWAMRNQGRPAPECLPLADRALSLSAGASEQEIAFMTGTRHDLAGDLPRALAAYEAFLRLQPRDPRAMALAIDGYSRAGRFKEAVRHSVNRAEIAPDDFYANVSAARALMVWQADPEAARRFVSRSVRLATNDAVSERPYWGGWLMILPVFTKWLDNDIAGAMAAVAPLEAGLEKRIGRERDGFATAVGFSYLTLGRLRDAERTFRASAAPVRQVNLALLALSVGDEAKARDWLLQIRKHSRERPALFARVGLVSEAETGLAESFGSEHAEGIAAVTRGLIASRRGQTAVAIESLRQGIDLLRFSGEPEYFLAVEAMERIWSMRGDYERSTMLLTEAAQQRVRTCASARWAGAYWIRLNAQLLTSHRRRGQDAEAERLRLALHRMLEHADADHPLIKLVDQAGG